MAPAVLKSLRYIASPSIW